MERKNPFQSKYDICNGKIASPPEFPIIIDIELTNFCNFECLMCPTGNASIKRKQGFMSPEIFRKVLDEIEHYDVGLRFIRWGEPLLHRNFFEFIEETKKRGILCHVNTNGSLLTDELATKLIDINLDSIKFSFQGINEETYNEMRQKGDFNTLIKTVKGMHKLRGEKESPYMHISSTITYESSQQADDFKKNVSSFCDLVTIGRTKLEHIDIDKTKASEEQKLILKKLKESESLHKIRHKMCTEVFAKLSVNWDGTVTSCCDDYDGTMNVGDIQNSSLKEIWKSEKQRKHQDILAMKDFDKIVLCSQCYDRMGIQSKENSV